MIHFYLKAENPEIAYLEYPYFFLGSTLAFFDNGSHRFLPLIRRIIFWLLYDLDS